jgi:hypothetical protein
VKDKIDDPVAAGNPDHDPNLVALPGEDKLDHYALCTTEELIEIETGDCVFLGKYRSRVLGRPYLLFYQFEDEGDPDVGYYGQCPHVEAWRRHTSERTWRCCLIVQEKILGIKYDKSGFPTADILRVQQNARGAIDAAERAALSDEDAQRTVERELFKLLRALEALDKDTIQPTLSRMPGATRDTWECIEASVAKLRGEIRGRIDWLRDQVPWVRRGFSEYIAHMNWRRR